MLRIPRDDAVVNRRYTVRRFEPQRSAVTMDVSLHGRGPGTDSGPVDDGRQPRRRHRPAAGKITLSTYADWHLFVADETGMHPGALAMMEALPAGGTAIALLEVDGAADEQAPTGDHGGRLDLRRLHRQGNSVPWDDAVPRGAGRVELSPGNGHAYVSAEARVVRAVRALLLSRGFEPGQGVGLGLLGDGACPTWSTASRPTTTTPVPPVSSPGDKEGAGPFHGI